uniref:Transposase n=1 Tax=Heterorhabditis bacteriophora TaxID=37862 RepID=A0A1I7W7U0_HETBA
MRFSRNDFDAKLQCLSNNRKSISLSQKLQA